MGKNSRYKTAVKLLCNNIFKGFICQLNKENVSMSLNIIFNCWPYLYTLQPTSKVFMPSYFHEKTTTTTQFNAYKKK